MPDGQTPAQADALLSLREVAAITHTPLDTLRRWCRDSENLLPHVHQGPTRRIRVHWQVVIEFFPNVSSGQA
jgi:hypothetical protein